MLALLYIVGFTVAGMAAIALIYLVSPTIAWVCVALLWFWAYRSPTINDWRLQRRLRKIRPEHQDSK